MMRRRLNGAVAILLFSVLFATTFPQVSALFYPAVAVSVARVQGGDEAVGETVPTLAAASLSGSSASGNAANSSSANPPSSGNQPSSNASGPAAKSSMVTVTPTPTQASQSGVSTSPKHIGLQAGHWKYKEAPAPLNTMTGTSGGGKTESEITLAIATEVARILRGWGHVVDILPTVIPPNYKADLVVAIHADGSNNASARGFFTDRPSGSPVATAETRLSSAIDAEYVKATGIPYVNRSTPNSHYYYGFRDVAASVPMVLIETGFLTNATDQEILIKQPGRSAEGIANGIKRYLGQ